MKFLYVKTRSTPALLAGRPPSRNMAPWLAWFLEDEEVERLAVELRASGYEVDSGVPIKFDFSDRKPGEY